MIAFEVRMRRWSTSGAIWAFMLLTSGCDWPQPGSFVIDSPKDGPDTRARPLAVPQAQPDPVPTSRSPSAQPASAPPASASSVVSEASARGSGAGRPGAGSSSGGVGGTNQGSATPIGVGSSQGDPTSGTGPTGEGGPSTRASLPPDCMRARFHGVEPPTGAVLNGEFTPEPASVAIALRLVSECFPITIVAARLTYVWRDASGTASLVPVIVRLAVPVTLNPSSDGSDGPVTTVQVDLRSLQLEPFLKGLRTSGELSAQVQFVQADGATVQGVAGSDLTVEVPVER